jgi:Holliday junction resolvase
MGQYLHRYIKGARSERELLNKFYELGYSVVRSAGSGVNALGPDIIAMKKGVCLSIECKAWDRGSLSLEPDQYQKLVDWERNTDGLTFVAWRINNRGWYFIRLDEFSRGDRNYNVTMRRTFEINRDLRAVLSMSNSSGAGLVGGGSV